jgi:signal peptidase I
MNGKESNQRPGSTAGEPKYETRTPLRDNLESIVLAILMVLLVRQVVVEAFKIPTGSMAPTLLGIHKEVRCPNCGWTFQVGSGANSNKIGPDGDVICPNCRYIWSGAGEAISTPYGNDRISFRNPAWLWHSGKTVIGKEPIDGLDAANRIDRWGCRILVNKFVYKLRKPRRWEVIVFKYPYGPQNYIKRLVGLPGESISIRGGDVYVDGKIARKPQHIQDQIWIPVTDSRFVPEKEFVPRWDFGKAIAMWEENPESGSLRVSAGNSIDPALAYYARPVRDFYAYDGILNQSITGQGLADSHPVGDVKIDVKVTVVETPANDGYLIMGARDNQDDFTLYYPVYPQENAILERNGKTVIQRQVAPLRPGEATCLSFENYDNRVVVESDGKAVLKHEYSCETNRRKTDTEIFFGAQKADATFQMVKIHRDIYYTNSSKYLPGHNYKLNDGEYFVLGDNSPYSKDSREWPNPVMPEENLMGRAFMVFWPVHELRILPAGQTYR